MTLTEGLLIVIVILLTVFILTRVRGKSSTAGTGSQSFTDKMPDAGEAMRKLLAN
jgi:hypothetical protein